MTTMLLSDFDIHLFHEGSLFESYKTFGAHIVEKDGEIGTCFSVWAPHAKEVRVVGEFNGWNGRNHVMTSISEQGVWSIFIPYILEGEIYKYEMVTVSGEIILKADPYAFYSEVRPNTASVVCSLDGYQWNDKKWSKGKAKKASYHEALAIYEVHLGSWKLDGSDMPYSYRELCQHLIPYVIENGFTHIELMPLVEHPYDRSWGYQGTGYYSVTSRYGSPHDFMYFIDQCHQHGIGVILDWVPGHFCKDAHGLHMFDGGPVFEYENMSVRENAVWGTANFDLGKPEVRSFLISNALFWMKYYHIDGFRVDAVANMLYWNLDGTHQTNPYAVNFLQKLNSHVSQEALHFLMTAEDSTEWPLVTSPVEQGGLGFSYKWNMGWMNDVLSYMECDPIHRKHMHHKITFSFHYAFSENFILPFSHDEVVHGKKSLLNKMPGSYEQKFPQLRLLLGYMMTHPGKKLLFMGGEFGQYDEWKDLEQLDWFLQGYETHQKMNVYTKDLLAFYKRSKPLWQQDNSYEGFQWIDANNWEQSIFPFIRKGKDPDDILIVVCNFTDCTYTNYRIGVPTSQQYNEVLNSENVAYGGSGRVNSKKLKPSNTPFHNQPYSVELTIPAFGICILRPVKSRKGSITDGKEKMCSDVVSWGTR